MRRRDRWTTWRVDSRQTLLFLGLLLVSVAFGLFLSSSRSLTATAVADLDQQWRTSYDLLVLPTDAQMPVAQGKVRPNALTGWCGGITFAQWEAIKDIPGVEIAAPIAVLGRVWGSLPRRPSSDSQSVSEPGLYRVTQSRETLGSIWPNAGSYTFYTLMFRSLGDPQRDHDLVERVRPLSGESFSIRSMFISKWEYAWPWFECLLTAVDPVAEDGLVGLGGAIQTGRFDDTFVPEILDASKYFSSRKGQAFEIPVALNLRRYVQEETQVTIQRVNLEGADYSDPVAVAQTIAQRGGPKYLDSLSRTEVLSLSLTPNDYQEAFSEGLNTAFGPGRFQALMGAPPGPVAYQAAPDLLGEKVLAPIAVGIDISRKEPIFRKMPDKPAEANIVFKLTGTFDIEKLGLEGPGGLAVPADNYVPPVLTLTHDASGRPLAKPRKLLPNGNPYSYIQEPPLMLTTMQAARLIAGDKSISSIRVRVAGIEQYSPEAQQKLERVAAEIVRRTGLNVTVTAGASPEKTLVFLPGFGSVPAAGYVEEWWTKAGVNVEVRQRIQWENLVFFLIVLAVAGLYVGNTALVTTLQKQGELGLLKALGWSDGSVAGRVLMQFFGPAILAGLLGVLISQAVALAAQLQLSYLQAAMVLPASLLVALLGSAAGLGVARRATPIFALRSGDVRTTAGRRGRARKGGLGLWSLAWSGLGGRPGTTTVNVIVTAVADGFLILLVSLLTSTRGYLSGTLLGRYILLHVETYHLAMAVVALMVAAVAAADSALLGVIQRRAQLGLLAATGWTPGHRFRLVLVESFILGVMGAVGGLLLGIASTLAVTQGRLTLLKALTSGGPAATVPLIIVPLAALGAAWRASRLPPGPALRDE